MSGIPMNCPLQAASRPSSSSALWSSSRRRRPATICEVAFKVEAQSAAAEASVGNRVRVRGPLKVFHVPKTPELELDGLEGEVKDVLTTWKGKTISANLPYRVQFLTTINEKPVKFVAHLRDSEFEVIQ